MITRKQKGLLYIVLGLATAVMIWPIGLLMLTFFADMNGEIPATEEEKSN